LSAKYVEEVTVEKSSSDSYQNKYKWSKKKIWEAIAECRVMKLECQVMKLEYQIPEDD
jgi:hypothetical protein